MDFRQGCGRVGRLRQWTCVVAGVVLAGVLGGVAGAQTYGDGYWVGTWATAPMDQKNSSGVIGGEQGAAQGLTLRQIAHVSLGGSMVRVTLSNEFGVEPLKIAAACAIAVRANGSAIVPSTSVPLLFGGRASVVIPPGALAVSDGAALAVKPLSDVAVSLYLPNQPMTVLSRHGFADQDRTTRLPACSCYAGADRREDVLCPGEVSQGLIDVKADAESGAIVTFGDSITDGAHSTRDANARWPDVLAARLAANKKTAKLGVLNEGIGGNRVLHDNTGPSALARFDRDVLAQAGVKYLIVLEGINDIGHAADPDPAQRRDIVTRRRP